MIGSRTYICALLLIFLGPASIFAQTDSIPEIVSGVFDFNPLLSSAPERMSQKDYAMYMVQLNNLHGLFESEKNQDWVDDFRFFDINGNRFMDAVFCGETFYYKGWHTLIMFGDSSMRYPIAFDAPGYVHDFKPLEKGIEMTLVTDPYGASYLKTIRHYFFDYAQDTAVQDWEVQLVGTTKIPEKMSRRPAELKLPSHLRTFPAVQNEPGVDYNQDGRIDAAGNIIAEFPHGAKMFVLASEKVEEMDWSFVMFLDPPKGKHVFYPPKGMLTGICGWIPTEAIED